ncbi:DUF835 domain-containing protein [Thermococcus sp.]
MIPLIRTFSVATPGSRIIDYRSLPQLLDRFSNKEVLLITRRPPNYITDVNGRVIWISKVNHPKAIHPSRIHVIEQITWDSLNNGVDSVIFDALEYMMIEHGIDKTLKFVGKLRDMTMYQNKEFYVTVSDGIDEKVLALLRRIVE